MPQEAIAQVVRGLPRFEHPDLIVGTDNFSDAGVYRVAPDLCIVQSLDFFPPLVDDPYIFGQIAAWLVWGLTRHSRKQDAASP